MYIQNTLYPVILKVPPEYEKLSIRERVKFLSRFARKAVFISEQLSVNNEQLAVSCGRLGQGVGYYLESFGELPKDENGAPLPVNGVYWSVTHKPGFVGGVVSCEPAGFDIERIKEYSDGLRAKIADDREWGLVDPGNRKSFFRYWTSKEAVLKAAGVGLSELSKCRVSRVVDDLHLELLFRNRVWIAEHFYFEDHMASILKNNHQVEWKVV